MNQDDQGKKRRAPILVTVDGPGGVGKSGVVSVVVSRLRAAGIRAHHARQPSSSALGAHIRASADLYRGMALACLVAGDRHHQLTVEIEPALAAGEVVVCDRYLPSSLVLQVLDGVAPSTVWALNKGVRVPRLAVFLRADADILTERVLARGAHNRFERAPDFAARELALFDTVAEELAEREWPVRVIDCTHLSLPETAAVVVEAIRPLIRDTSALTREP